MTAINLDCRGANIVSLSSSTADEVRRFFGANRRFQRTVSIGDLTLTLDSVNRFFAAPADKRVEALFPDANRAWKVDAQDVERFLVTLARSRSEEKSEALSISNKTAMGFGLFDDAYVSTAARAFGSGDAPAKMSIDAVDNARLTAALKEPLARARLPYIEIALGEANEMRNRRMMKEEHFVPAQLTGAEAALTFWRYPELAGIVHDGKALGSASAGAKLLRYLDSQAFASLDVRTKNIILSLLNARPNLLDGAFDVFTAPQFLAGGAQVRNLTLALMGRENASARVVEKLLTSDRLSQLVDLDNQRSKENRFLDYLFYGDGYVHVTQRLYIKGDKTLFDAAKVVLEMGETVPPEQLLARFASAAQAPDTLIIRSKADGALRAFVIPEDFQAKYVEARLHGDVRPWSKLPGADALLIGWQKLSRFSYYGPPHCSDCEDLINSGRGILATVPSFPAPPAP